MRYLWRAIVAGTLLVVGLVPSIALGQASTAQINGAVRDATAGALPGATVTATQTDTGFPRVASPTRLAPIRCRICLWVRTGST